MPLPFLLRRELAPATEPPVREPACEVELLRSGAERALIATTRHGVAAPAAGQRLVAPRSRRSGRRAHRVSVGSHSRTGRCLPGPLRYSSDAANRGCPLPWIGREHGVNLSEHP